MTRVMRPVIDAIWWVLYESSVYLLAGFALAGVFHVLFSRWTAMADRLRKGNIRSVLWATLVGVPLDLCSCSVLPVAMTLRRKGAKPGAVYSFVISVPEVDMVSILQTNALLGPVMAVVRPVVALITALVTGLIANFLQPWTDRTAPPMPGDGLPEAGRESGAPGADPEPAAGHVHAAGCEHDHGHDHGEGAPATMTEAPQGWRASARSALRFGFVEFFDDLIVSLLAGVVIGGLIAVLLPKIGLDRFAGGSFLAMAGILLLATPMYVCATASTPMAVGMIAGGVSPGAALVFLLAGPATNMAGLLVIAREMGRRGVALYLVCILVLSLAGGLAFDAALARGWFTIPVLTLSVAEEGRSWVKMGAAALVIVLSLASFRRTRLATRVIASVAQRTGLPLTVRRVGFAGATAALAAYVGSGVFTVEPGQRAAILRFGRATAYIDQPGVYVHAPWPFGGRSVESADLVRRVELGFRSNQPEMVQVDPSLDEFLDEAWVVTANADIIDLRWSVHYRMSAGEAGFRAWAFGVEDAEQVVRGAAESAMREAAATRGIDALLTVERDELEAELRGRLLGPMLERWGVGIDIVDVRLVDVHAPSPVHPAFREVASSAEQKMSMIDLALDSASITVSRAKAGAHERIEAARGAAAERISRATGDATLFTAKREAFAAQPYVAKLQAWLAATDGVLPGLKKYIALVDPERAKVEILYGVRGDGNRMPPPPTDVEH